MSKVKGRVIELNRRGTVSRLEETLHTSKLEGEDGENIRVLRRFEIYSSSQAYGTKVAVTNVLSPQALEKATSRRTSTLIVCSRSLTL